MLALDGGDLAAGGQDVVAGHRLDVVDVDDDGQPVAGAYRAAEDEALVAVDDAGVVEAELGVESDLLGGAQGDDDREGRRRDDVGVAEGLGGRWVDVGRVGVADRGRRTRGSSRGPPRTAGWAGRCAR